MIGMIVGNEKGFDVFHRFAKDFSTLRQSFAGHAHIDLDQGFPIRDEGGISFRSRSDENNADHSGISTSPIIAA